MDTVEEETSPPPSPNPDGECHKYFLNSSPSAPQIFINNEQLHSDHSSRKCSFAHIETPSNSRSGSRRASAIIQALRRPSQAVALSAAHAVMNQRRYIMRLFNDSNEMPKKDCEVKERRKVEKNRAYGNDALSIILSALYAKLLVVLGMAFPVIQVLSNTVAPFYYQGFYLYLYFGSIGFVIYMYATFVKEKALEDMINNYGDQEKMEMIKKPPLEAPKYGSFYLRLGAIGFGIGSMVYSGLEFGRYFELKSRPECNNPDILQAVTPVARMVLTLVQVQFIFLNSKEIDFNKHKLVSRFGIMHMIATNLCEWLDVLVEETKHEIIHLAEHKNATTYENDSSVGQDGLVMSTLVANASPFLFPCTIEYSLICAVILFEMWKGVKMKVDGDSDKNVRFNTNQNGVTTHFKFNQFGGRMVNSNHHFTIDCSNAHKGLFAGILVIVLTIISLIMFFVLTNTQRTNKNIAIFEVNVVELILYVVTCLAALLAMLKMRNLKYDRRIGHEGNSSGLGLDCTLLVVAQTGMFIYCVFSIIGCCFTNDSNNNIEVVVEIFSFIQTCIQTIFVLDAWWRKCRSIEQVEHKPGREIITFLIVANMAMWAINTLEKNRAEFRPSHLNFFGDWAWTIITHVSMPLAIFYRFHSTICLFEIWKTAYKIKTKYDAQLFPLM